MHKYFKQFLFLSILVFTLGFSFSNSQTTRASGNVLGFAWADGVGWMSLSSDNDHDPDTEGIQYAPFDFGLSAPVGNGPITGYAWSDNLGWIRFDGGCPDGTYSNQMAGAFCSAQKYNGEWRGFAKIVNIDGGDEYCFLPASSNNDNCGTVDAESAGYISLSKYNDHDRTLSGPQNSLGTSDYGVLQSAEGGLSGFAWNPLVGWIEFYPEDIEIEETSPLGLDGGGSYCPGDAINTTLTWTPQTVECTSSWSVDSYPPASSSATITAPTVSTDYTLTCGLVSDIETISILSENDSECQEDVDNPNNPDLLSDTNSMCVDNEQNPVTLSWSSSATSCTGNGPGSFDGYVFNDTNNDGEYSTQINVPLSPGTYSYSVTCDGFTSNTIEIDVFSEAECALNEGGGGNGGGSGGKPIFEEF
jgi:hypothetical protein